MKEYQCKSDEELFNMIGVKNEKAFSELYDRYKRPLLFYALQKVPTEDSEDIIQELFYRIWNNPVVIRSKVSYYLFKSLRNRIIDYYSRDENAQKYIYSLKHFAENSYDIKADHLVREKMFYERINLVLSKFDAKSQEIFDLRIKGYSNPEIAERLGVSEKTVRNKYSLMIGHLRENLPFIIISLFFN